MNRRALLAGASGGLVALLAGCTSGGDSPDAGTGTTTTAATTTTATATTTASDAASGSTAPESVDDPAAVFEQVLESEYDIQVESAKSTPEAFTFRYRSQYNETLDMRDEIAKILGTYAGLYKRADDGLGDAKGTILAPDGSSENGSLEIKASWAADYLDTEDSDTYFTRVEGTVVLDGVAKILSSEYVEGDYSNSVTGQIKNTSGLPLGYLEVAAKYYNADGNVVGNGMDNVSNLGAGETYEFELYVPSDADVNEYKLEWST